MGTLGLMHNVMCHMHYKTEAQNVTGMLRLMHKVSQALQDLCTKCHRHIIKTDAQFVTGTSRLIKKCYMHNKTEAQSVTCILRLIHKMSHAL